MNTFEKRKALREFLNNTYNDDLMLSDITVEERYGYEEYHTPHGEFLVLTDDEADDLHTKSIENLIDDIGVAELFGNNNSYIIENYVDFDFFADWERESRESYYYDIEYEGDRLFNNRLQRELFEHKFDDCRKAERYAEEYFDALGEQEDLEADIEELKDKINELEDNLLYEEDEEVIEETNDYIIELRNELDDKEIELDAICIDEDVKEWFENYESDKDNLIEEAVEEDIDRIEREEGWYEYIEWNFGKDYVSELVKDGHATIDIDGIAEYIRDSDGRGNELARWDGVEEEQNGFYIYQQDNTIYPRVEEKEAEDMIKDVIVDYADANGIELNEYDIDTLTDIYMDMQEWNEDEMTTGNSIGEVQNWIRHADIDSLLENEKGIDR